MRDLLKDTSLEPDIRGLIELLKEEGDPANWEGPVKLHFLPDLQRRKR